MDDRVSLSVSLEQEAKVPDVKGHEGAWQDVVTHLDNTDYHKMANFLGVNSDDRRDPKVAERIGFLGDWAKEICGSDDVSDHYAIVKQFIRDLGLPMVGKELIDRIYRFARLEQERRRIDKEMELYREKPKEETKPKEEVKDF